MPVKLVTLTTYTYVTEAYVLVARLEAEGIKSLLRNEHLLSTQQFLSNAVGGLDVQVEEGDLENARIILNDLERERSVTAQGLAELEKDYEKVLTYCPECESSDIYRKKGSLFSFRAREHLCTDCKHTWKQ